MRSIPLLMAAGLSCTVGPSFAQTSGAMLRIGCTGDAVGAEVRVNGVFKGECPVDVEVRAGLVKVEAAKPVGNLERVFGRELHVADGTVKRVDVVLGEPGLSAKAREQAQRDAEHKLAQERERKRLHDDAVMMVAKGEAYKDGKGVPPDPAQALAWYRRGAEAGSEIGTYKAHILQQRAGKPYSFDPFAVHILMGGKPALRTDSVEGSDAARQFVLTNSFFDTPKPATTQKISFKSAHHGTQITKICVMSPDNLRRCEVVAPEGRWNEDARLGGLASVALSTVTAGGVSGYPSAYSGLFGTPFPSVPNVPFGYDVTQQVGDRSHANTVRCAWRATRSPTGKEVVDCLIGSDEGYVLKSSLWLPDYGMFADVNMVRE